MNTGSNYPEVFIIDLRRVLEKYHPDAREINYLYRNDQILAEFVRSLTIQTIIMAEFINYYDVPSDSNVWSFIEHMYPNGTGAFEESINSLEGFQLLNDMVIEEVDHLLHERFEANGIFDYLQDFVFDHWLTPYVAIFVHRNFIPMTG